VRYTVRFLPDAEREFLRLPRRLQRQFKDLLPYLEAGPYRAYPFLPVKEARRVPGLWRFPLGPYRVFYRVQGDTVWIGKLWFRPASYDRTHIRQLRRALRR